MWADTLYLVERAHLLRLFAWSGASVLAGVLIMAFLRLCHARSPLLLNFALQTAAWGAITLIFAFMAWGQLRYRDLAAFTQLDRILWLNVGLDVGYVGVGLTLLLTALALGRRLAPMGAGIGIAVQGLALLFLDLLFMARIGAIQGM